ncbi:MAG: protein kinase domain-containing protein [Planctomycetota bacterium]|jgi:serine/threonine-protein kinase
MVLAAGERLTIYEIVGPLGAGGMGEVYRARDTRLERDVAIKVLPGDLVEDEKQLRRFRREAKLLAALNHPNIAAIYGLDQVDGLHFLVLELVPGVTLRDRLATGPMPVREAVKFAEQVAAGLEAAHREGIVHRDLKPANIILRPDGVAKVLDFGLAKQTEVADESGDGEPLTQAYQVVGTPGYLSPEQARGEKTTRRADVWAFGCILYECLTGRRAFPGKTVSERIQAMFESDGPDLDSLPPLTPPTVRLLVSRCLAKDSTNRLRNIGDVKRLLESALSEPSTTTGQPVVIEKEAVPARRPVLLLVALAAALVAIGFLLARGGGGAVVAEPAVLALPFDAELGWRETSANLSKLGGGSPMLAISPDGKRVAYCATNGKQSRIHLHARGEFDPKPVPETLYGRGPFFSRKGDLIGFHADSALQVVAADGGGAPERICEIAPPNFAGCFTSDDQAIVYATSKGLWIVSLDKRQPRGLTTLARGEVGHSEPAMAGPDHVLFTVSTGTSAFIAMVTIGSGERLKVVNKGTSPRYVGGTLLFAQGGAVRRVAFDPQSPSAARISKPVVDRVYTSPSSGGGLVLAHYDVAPDGTIAYAPPTGQPTRSTAYWVRRDGEGVGEPITGGVGTWRHARLDPEERGFAVDILLDSGTKDVAFWDFERGAFHNLTTDGMGIMSAWTGAGKATIRSTHAAELLQLFPNPGGSPRDLVTGLTGRVYADAWSADGATLTLTRKDGEAYSIWAYTRGADRARQLLDEERNPRYGRISPDGRWLVYVAEERPNEPEVFVGPYDDLGSDWVKVSTDGGGEPMWSPDGKELFYRRQDGTMFAVTFDTEPRFRAHSPKRLFANRYDPEPGGHQHYDVAKDGRFLMIGIERTAPDRVHMLPRALD